MRKIDILFVFFFCSFRSHIHANTYYYTHNRRPKEEEATKNCAKCRKLLNGTKIEQRKAKQTIKKETNKTYSEIFLNTLEM